MLEYDYCFDVPYDRQYDSLNYCTDCGEFDELMKIKNNFLCRKCLPYYLNLEEGENEETNHA